MSAHETAPSETTPSAEARQPVLRVLTHSATPEEIAAVVAVFSALGGAAGAPVPRKPRSQWAHPARGVRTGWSAGRGAWRASGLPR